MADSHLSEDNALHLLIAALIKRAGGEITITPDDLRDLRYCTIDRLDHPCGEVSFRLRPSVTPTPRVPTGPARPVAPDAPITHGKGPDLIEVLAILIITSFVFGGLIVAAGRALGRW